MLAHQWYILARSPDAFFALLLKLVTLPLQLAPERFTRPGLLLPFFLPSAKFSLNSFQSNFNFLTFMYWPPTGTSLVAFCFVTMPTPAASFLGFPCLLCCAHASA